MKLLLFISVFLTLLSQASAQDWKHYPYNPEHSLISFPKDEGHHTEEPTEWWYTFAKLKGVETGNEYTAMFTFFVRDTLFFDGLRIFNISNENTGEFFHDAKPVNYNANATDHLDIEAEIYGQSRVETWKTKTDSTGKLIPFNYNLKAKAPFGSIDLDFDVVKRPLILADSGFLYQGSKNFTYYYSFTEINVKGRLDLEGTNEKVEGKAWFDKQYGNFHPEVEEKYEWLSLKLSNGIDINLWQIFNNKYEVPKTPEFRQFNCYIDDSTAMNTTEFSIDRLEYFYSPDSARTYCKKFLIKEPNLKLKLIVEVANPNCEPSFPFNFYEGPLDISGTVDGTDVTGFGFGELLHTYEKPRIEFVYPIDPWNILKPIQWKILNPDFGMPIFFNIYSKTPNTDYQLLKGNFTDSIFTVNPANFNSDSSYSFLLKYYSVDSFFLDTISTKRFYRPLSNTQAQKESIKIYPTLFANKLTVQNINTVFTTGTKIALISENSQIIFERILKQNTDKITINTENISKGIYILIITKGDSFYSKKIIHAFD